MEWSECSWHHINNLLPSDSFIRTLICCLLRRLSARSAIRNENSCWKANMNDSRFANVVGRAHAYVPNSRRETRSAVIESPFVTANCNAFICCIFAISIRQCAIERETSCSAALRRAPQTSFRSIYFRCWIFLLLLLRFRWRCDSSQWRWAAPPEANRRQTHVAIR